MENTEICIKTMRSTYIVLLVITKCQVNQMYTASIKKLEEKKKRNEANDNQN